MSSTERGTSPDLPQRMRDSSDEIEQVVQSERRRAVIAGVLSAILAAGAVSLFNARAMDAEREADATQAQAAEAADLVIAACDGESTEVRRALVRAGVCQAAKDVQEQAAADGDTETPTVRQGARGPMGPSGPPGARGSAGDDGSDGSDGRDGSDGDPGATGDDGTDGAPGEDGADGAPGSSGTDGDDGARGAPGAAGADGQDGATGPTGAQGPTGDTGATGAQGPPGPAGQDGTNGAPGADGSDGVGIASIACIDGQLVVTLTDGTTQNVDGATACQAPDPEPDPEPVAP